MIILKIKYNFFSSSDKLLNHSFKVSSSKSKILLNKSFTDLEDALNINYNKSVKTYKAIQDYIMLKIADYPTFKGIELKYNQWF